LTDVHVTGQPVAPEDAGRRISMQGRFDAKRSQVLIVDRRDEGRDGFWVVAPFLVRPTAAGEAATIPVVRGWIPADVPAPSVPSGPQRVSGTLEPSESEGIRRRDREPLPDGQLEIVSSPELLSLWQPPLYQGFVVQERPESPEPLESVQIPTRAEVATDWQNAAYAVQWWLFGLFAIFWFGRMVRIELEDQRAGVDENDGTAVGTMEAPGEPLDQKDTS
jgi:cytochrome oxidase assembly protein ShyY1